MLNTQLYKSVYNLAGELINAANNEDKPQFDLLYTQLHAICVDNENSEKDHPVQWETLADFTEDLEEAITLYQKALDKAVAINSKDYMSSIAFSMATLQTELGHIDAAIKNLQNAKTHANKSDDKELKLEIDELLKALLI